jgi:glutamate-1-semialdehyde 2,1-aminomutase
MSSLAVDHRRNSDLDAVLSDARQRFSAANPKSMARHRAAAASLPGGNTRAVLWYRPFPLTLVGGDGCMVEDLDGHRYCDLVSEYSAGLYGHSETATAAAMKQAIDDGVLLGAPNQYEARYAEAIVDRFPAIERVRFCNSGTEANIMALSAARAVTGRSKILVFREGYHGGVLTFAHGGSVLNLPFPFVFANYNDIDGTEAIIRGQAGDLAAVILEPMMGGGGCIPATRDFLAMLRAVTSETGTLLIFDEVMTSRLAYRGLHGAHGINPDLVTLGKYLGGGASFGGFGGRADVMDRFDPSSPHAFSHGGTFNNNVLSMAAGLAGFGVGQARRGRNSARKGFAHEPAFRAGAGRYAGAARGRRSEIAGPLACRDAAAWPACDTEGHAGAFTAFRAARGRPVRRGVRGFPRQCAADSAACVLNMLERLARSEASTRDTTHARVYAGLRSALMNGDFLPGQRLVVRLIAERFETSAMPVREALRQLVSDEALFDHPHRGVIVPEATVEVISDLVRVRCSIEGAASEWAASTVTAREIDAIDELNRKMIDCAARGDAANYLRWNREFHFSIYRAARSQVLQPIIERLWLRAGPWLNIMRDVATLGMGLDHHAEILDSLHRGDGARARKAMVADISGAADIMLRAASAPLSPKGRTRSVGGRPAARARVVAGQ